jgi:anti-sigma B factor antagonist
MSGHRRLEVSRIGDVTVVRFVDRRILDHANIEQIDRELIEIVEQDGCNKLLLNFSDVEFFSSAALGRLVKLDKTLKKKGGALVLSNIRPTIYDAFNITQLYKVFDIKEDEAEALAALAS